MKRNSSNWFWAAALFAAALVALGGLYLPGNDPFSALNWPHWLVFPAGYCWLVGLLLRQDEALRWKVSRPKPKTVLKVTEYVTDGPDGSIRRISS